jgi:NADH-quinone oxidoreductase subunit F
MVAESLPLGYVDETVARLGRRKDAVIPILQALQEHYRYLPEPALRRVCEISEITPAQIWGIATFYDQFRHRPVGKHIVHVCHGTACHVTGADRVEDALRRHLKIKPGEDTNPDGQFTIEPVACLGCCTLAPVIKLDQLTAGMVDTDKVPSVIGEFLEAHRDGEGRDSDPEGLLHGGAGGGDDPAAGRPEIRVGLGSCCMAKGSDRLFGELHRAARLVGVEVQVKRVGCVGMCHQTPLIEVFQPGKPSRFYAAVKPNEARQLVLDNFRPPSLWRRLTRVAARAVDRVLLEQDDSPTTRCAVDMNAGPARAFLGRQIHIASEHFGDLDPLDLEEYLRHDGFVALRKCLVELKPDQIIDHVTRSGLRGRGGAGYPTGPKWTVMRSQTAETKYVICNGDEGDPGAFMDRMLLESFPYRIIEGLAIAALATGAHEGIFYIRREYPLAVQRIQAAIDVMEKRGWLGERLLGTKYPFRVSIKEGAGAFVCGEETALIASIEGQRGMPRLRPPFPAQSGLWNRPTLINNVETLACVPWILRRGGDAFAAIGTKSSKGTKVFALAGKVQRGGLIEVPMGTTIREIVDEIGGGVTAGRRFKAVQIGGPLRRLRPRPARRHAGRLRLPARGRGDHGVGRAGGPGRYRLHGRHRPVFPPVHPGPILRQMHFLPRGHAADARSPRTGLRRQRPPRAPRRTDPPGGIGRAGEPVRPREDRAKPDRHHPPLLPGRVRSPSPGTLPVRQMPGPDPVRDLRPLHGVHHLLPAVPGERHPVHPLRPPRHPPGPLHQVRHLQARLPLRRGHHPMTR